MKNLMVHLVLIALFTGCSGIDWFPASFIITPSSLPGATVGVAYNQTLTASGSTSSTFSWTVESGALPDGLGLGTSTGILSGTPTRAGTFSFTIKVTGANALFATQKYTIAVVLPPSIDQTQISAAVFNVPYLQTLSVTGGTSPYIWSVSTGTLPTWLTLNQVSGTLSGTPDAVGTSTFTIQVKDSNNLTATQTYSLTTFSINPAQLPNATLHVPYSQTITAAGGVPPYTWTVTAGSFPAGLFLASLTGTISGAPLVTGDFPVTITVADSQTPAVTASKDFIITSVP